MRFDTFDGPVFLQKFWDRVHRLPGGKALFSRSLGRIAPYSGTIRPKVLELRKGWARVAMEDRPNVRNHLGSLHAIALMNIAEVATGLALLYGLPPGSRAILTGLSIDFLHKARGTVVATCTCTPPTDTTRAEHLLIGEIHDGNGTLVARAEARWLVGPLQKR